MGTPRSEDVRLIETVETLYRARRLRPIFRLSPLAPPEIRFNFLKSAYDFEALLRQTLSTRDGHVLSVTMLGSDMGKLYVALAQAIQRFRT